MPINQSQDNSTDISQATNILDLLFGNPEEAQAFSQDGPGWVESHGFAGVDPSAVSECGANMGYAGNGGASFGAGAAGGSAAASASASASAAAAAGGAAGVAAALNPVVYNYYTENNLEDNSSSITNNILANGDVDVDNTVQNIHGDGNVATGGDMSGSQVQTGDGVQAGGDISDSNVATGDNNQQAIDNSVDSHDTTSMGGDAQGGEGNLNVHQDEEPPLAEVDPPPNGATDLPDMEG